MLMMLKASDNNNASDFITNQIKVEAALELHKALGKHYGLDSINELNELRTIASGARVVAGESPDQRNRTTGDLCGVTPSPMLTTMEQFSLMDTVNDPTPFLARQAMKNAGCDVGSLESIDARTKAAKDTAAMPVRAPPECYQPLCDEIEVEEDEDVDQDLARQYRPAGALGQPTTVRVNRKIVGRGRRFARK